MSQKPLLSRSLNGTLNSEADRSKLHFDGDFWTHSISPRQSITLKSLRAGQSATRRPEVAFRSGGPAPPENLRAMPPPPDDCKEAPHPPGNCKGAGKPSWGKFNRSMESCDWNASLQLSTGKSLEVPEPKPAEAGAGSTPQNPFVRKAKGWFTPSDAPLPPKPSLECLPSVDTVKSTGSFSKAMFEQMDAEKSTPEDDVSLLLAGKVRKLSVIPMNPFQPQSDERSSSDEELAGQGGLGAAPKLSALATEFVPSGVEWRVKDQTQRIAHREWRKQQRELRKLGRRGRHKKGNYRGPRRSKRHGKTLVVPQAINEQAADAPVSL